MSKKEKQLKEEIKRLKEFLGRIIYSTHKYYYHNFPCRILKSCKCESAQLYIKEYEESIKEKKNKN